MVTRYSNESLGESDWSGLSLTPTCLSSGALVASGHLLAAEACYVKKQEAPV